MVMNRNSGVALKAIIEHRLLSILDILDHVVRSNYFDGFFTIISNKIFSPQSRPM